jgi:hypothetical protein
MMMRFSVIFFLLGLVSTGIAHAKSVELKARGVNPADNDTRADVILKYNRLKDDASIFTTTLKFDYRITQEIGFNAEMPVISHFNSPALDNNGIGDLFLRLRYITLVGENSMGSTSIGVASELVLPTAAERTLGTGTTQLNATGLAVQAWSPELITAFVGKAAQSVDRKEGRADIQENTVRVVQAFILPRGMFSTLDAKYNFETVNVKDVWYEGAAEFGMMLDAQTAGSINVSRKWRDRSDQGAVTFTVKRFF